MSNYEKSNIINQKLDELYKQLEARYTTEATLNIITSIEKLENLKKDLGL